MVDYILLSIAKSAIIAKFDDSYSLDLVKLRDEHPFLNKEGAVFVTLNHNDQLRGCIGSVVAYRDLLDDVIHNAKAAAFEDPRFNALDKSEFDDLTLEVSVLSEPEILEYSDYDDLQEKVTPHVDGLILKHGSYQGTFLPQVWEQLPSPKQFLDHLSVKAGANPAIYESHPTIYRYRVEHIKDSFDNIPILY